MASKIDWQEAARSFSIDFDEFAKSYAPVTASFKPIFDDLKEVQRLNKEFYDLDYKSKLSVTVVDSLDSEAQQYRQLVSDLQKLLSIKQPRPKREAQRLLNEAAVRKREIRYYASQHLPYLRQEAEGDSFFKDQREQLEKEIKDLKSQKILGDIVEVFDGDIERHKEQEAGGWLRQRLYWFISLLVLALLVLIVSAEKFVDVWWIGAKITAPDSFDITEILISKLIFLSLIAVCLVGFVFSNRNYRIAMHLYESKVNKKISLKLLLGVMNSRVYVNASQDEKAAIVKSACESIFSNGTVGHLRSQAHDESLLSQIVSVHKK